MIPNFSIGPEKTEPFGASVVPELEYRNVFLMLRHRMEVDTLCQVPALDPVRTLPTNKHRIVWLPSWRHGVFLSFQFSLLHAVRFVS